MRTVNIHLDPAVECGKMQNILGICNQPTVTFEPRLARQVEWFNALHPVCVRHHDAPLENAGMNLIDVSRIFPLFDLDEQDPKNYRFEQTDDYLAVIADQEIEFRFGESIDHSGHSRLVNPPADFGKWARICLNILRHYRDGWASGMHLHIHRAAIWEEPDTVPQLFTGTVDDYARLYVTTYKVLHEAYPDLLIGGPNCGYWNPHYIEAMLKSCRENDIVPGFVAITIYTRDISEMLERVHAVRALLDQYGFPKTGITFSEWHLGPYSWGENGHYGMKKNGFDGAQSAAFTASALIRLSDSPLDIAFYYAWATGVWGLIRTGETVEPLPVYYGLKYYSDITDCKTRLAVDSDAPAEVSMLAGITEHGSVQLLVSAYDACAAEYRCTLPGYTGCTVKAVSDRVQDNSPTEAQNIVPDAEGRFCFTMCTGGSGVYLLEFAK